MSVGTKNRKPATKGGEMAAVRRAMWSLATFLSYSHLLPYLAAAPNSLSPATTHYEFNVTVAQKAPDCFGEDMSQCNDAKCPDVCCVFTDAAGS